MSRLHVVLALAHWGVLALVTGCTGFQSVNTQPHPRLLAPLSTATVSVVRPTLRFSVPAPLSSPVVDLCANRSCDGTRRNATVSMSGDSAVPDEDLAPGVWYWRVRASGASSPVWQFVVQPAGGVEASWGSQLDLNGDGFAELAVGAPIATVGTEEGTGRVYLYIGGADGPDPTQPIVIDGPSSGGQFGESLAAVDFDGDGFADLAVGAPTAFIPGGDVSGLVYVFRGGPNGIDPTPTFTLQDLLTGGLGWSLDCAGDVNGDGYGDLIAGAPTTRQDSGNLSGSAYVFFGGANPGAESASPLMPQDANNESIGWSVAGGGGDIDNDGHADVIVGAPRANTSAGLAFIYFSRVSGSAGTPLTIDVSPPPLATFGSAAVSLGDIDGDGHADYAISAPAIGPGRVYLFTQAATPLIIDGPDLVGASFGTAMASADLDGDGKNDLAVTANCAPGGSASCLGAAYLVVGGALTKFAAPSGVVSYGTAVTLGDLDGDGHADLTVGASENDGELGRVDWYRNGIAGSAPRVLNGVDPGGRFGFAVR